jgi:MoxR-like ATPase
MTTERTPITVHCSAGMEAHSLMGELRPNGTGILEWKDGPVTRAIREDRPLVLLEFECLPLALVELLWPVREVTYS